MRSERAARRTFLGAVAIVCAGPVVAALMLLTTSANGWALAPGVLVEVVAFLVAADLLRPRKHADPEYLTQILSMLDEGKVTPEQADTLIMRSTIVSGDEP